MKINNPYLLYIYDMLKNEKARLRKQLSDLIPRAREDAEETIVITDRLQELSGVIEAMNQVLPSLALAQLKVIDKMIKDKRYR